VTTGAAGSFVVAWRAGGTDGDGYGIAARRFTSAGTPVGVQFTVNTYTTGNQDFPAISGDSSGAFGVFWESPGDGSGRGVFGQLYGSSGAPVGTEFRVNTITASEQYEATAAFGKTIVVAWSGPDSSLAGIHARVFAPPCKPGDANGDGVVDVADVFHLINFLFASGPAPVCKGNVNGDALSDVSDVFYLINYLFASGPPPV
jgi:hypothetical protein